MDGGQPFGWTLRGEAWQVTDTDAVVEINSLFLADADLEAEMPAAEVLSVTLVPGIYVLSAWVKTDDLGASHGDSPQGVRLVVQNDTVAEGDNSLFVSPLVSGTQDWHQMIMRFEVLETSDYAVRIEAYNRPSGLAWVDEISLTAESFDQLVVSQTEYTESELLETEARDRAGQPANGSFESLDANQLPQDWVLDGTSWRAVDTEAKEGALSLSLQDADKQAWWPEAKSQSQSLEAGTYLLSGWVRTHTGGRHLHAGCARRSRFASRWISPVRGEAAILR